MPKKTTRKSTPRRELQAAAQIAAASDGPAQPGIDAHAIGAEVHLEIDPGNLWGHVIIGAEPEPRHNVVVSTDPADRNADFDASPPV